jgi:hypothetical protein
MEYPKRRSACFDCPPELRSYESNRCKKCEKKHRRLEDIGGLCEPAPMRTVKGGDMPMPKNSREIPNKEKIIKAIKGICEANDVSYDRELLTKNKDKKVTQVRRYVIVTLAREPHGLNSSQIAKVLSLSQQYVSHVAKHHQYLKSTQHNNLKVPDENKNPGNIIDIDFNGNEDLLEIVEQLAIKELRPVRLQLLRMIQSQAVLLQEEYNMDRGDQEYGGHLFGF